MQKHMDVQQIKMTERNRNLTIEQLAWEYPQGTGLSWLWGLLFGPLYFLFNGFWKRGILIFLIGGLLVAVFPPLFILVAIYCSVTARSAWSKRAIKQATVIYDRSR